MSAPHPPSTFRRRGSTVLLMVAIIAAVAVTGLVVVRAEWNPIPTVKPYDPLPRW